MLTLFVAMIVLLLNLSVGSFRNTAQMKDQERLMHSWEYPMCFFSLGLFFWGLGMHYFLQARINRNFMLLNIEYIFFRGCIHRHICIFYINVIEDITVRSPCLLGLDSAMHLVCKAAWVACNSNNNFFLSQCWNLVPFVVLQVTVVDPLHIVGIFGSGITIVDAVAICPKALKPVTLTLI